MILSPSVKNSNYWQESLLELIRQIIAGWCNNLLVFKKLLTTPSNVLPLHLNQTFPPIFEFSQKVKVMGSDPGYLLKSFLLFTWFSWFRAFLETILNTLPLSSQLLLALLNEDKQPCFESTELWEKNLPTFYTNRVSSLKVDY